MKGFKQTESGVIPDDWLSITISSASKLINGRGFKPHEWQKEGLPIIRIQNLNGSEEYNYFSGSYDKKLEVKFGQLLFAWSGSKGTSFGPHIWKGETGLLNYHTWKVEINESNIEKEYYLHALKNLTKYIEDKAHGASALVHVQKWEMEKFQFPCPSIKSEQTAIATALSDADALITSLEKLIEKKLAIKQGAMQQLLNPKKGWKVKTLGEVGKCHRGVSYNPEQDLHPYDTTITVRLLRSNNIQNGSLTLNSLQFVNNQRVKANQIIQENDIVICMANGSKQLVGKSSIFKRKDNNKYTFGAFMGCFRTDENLASSEFVASTFQSYQYRSFIDVLLSGSSINNLSPNNIESIEIPFPAEPEQTRIATILSEMNTEITALQQKLLKYKLLKQGMMQELLTGKIRLV